MTIWIVNDRLTCIPGTRTFWHCLLELPGAVDKTGVDFAGLASAVASDPAPCDLIIRNATFFPPIERAVPQIAFVQDCYPSNLEQRRVCQRAEVVVFNSDFTATQYAAAGWPRTQVIPIGVDEAVFSPRPVDMARFAHRPSVAALRSRGVPIGIFVGDATTIKGAACFAAVVAERQDIGFLYVSKCGDRIDLPNVVNFPGGTNESTMADLYNLATFAIMCSPRESLHLASLEAALCDRPVIGTPTGWLATHYAAEVGIRVGHGASVATFSAAIDEVAARAATFSPRAVVLRSPFTWEQCRATWAALIADVLGGSNVGRSLG